MGIIHGDQARPRAIFLGLKDELVAQLAPLVGYHVAAPDSESLLVDDREYDLLVTTGDVESRGHLHVLALGAKKIDKIVTDGRHRGAYRHNEVTASQLVVPEGTDPTLEALFLRTLVPALASQRLRPRWRWGDGFPYRTGSVGVTALLTSHADDEVLAFMARRESSNGVDGLVVALPVTPTDIPAWVRWFVNQARTLTPEAFPERTDWHEDARWAPPTLSAALRERDELKAERERVLVELDRREVELEANVAGARSTAEAGPWRLITKQGDEFESAVVDALETLGFDVERRDQTAPGQPKLEDLRITDPADPGWVALAECKGLAKGAQARAIVQLTNRPVHAYRATHENGPDALYYIVNHNMAAAPSERPEPLESDPTSISLLAEYGGAVVDSRALLLAQVSALADPTKAPQLREAMRTSRGRWDGTTSTTVVGLEDPP